MDGKIPTDEELMEKLMKEDSKCSEKIIKALKMKNDQFRATLEKRIDELEEEPEKLLKDKAETEIIEDTELENEIRIAELKKMLI